jgi:hypothetical protein
VLSDASSHEPVTVAAPPRPRNVKPLARTCSGFLILVLAASAFACSSGVCGGPESTRCSSTLAACARKKPQTTACLRAPCGYRLKSPSRRCSLRSFAQFQFAKLARFEIPIPLRREAEVSRAPNLAPIVSSVGSPETDRSPPTLLKASSPFTRRAY